MKKCLLFFQILVVIVSLLFIIPFPAYGLITQDDTVRIRQVSNPPIIDGDPSDSCWNLASWQVINQVWIPYGTTIDSADFYGRYKALWSSDSNRLYFLVETTDDIFVDGYIYRSDPNGNNYPDYDILEVFIDENRSKGLHVFDGTGQTGIDWGTNAENAFSYHIAVMSPADGEVTTDKVVCDIAGTDWSHEWIMNYASHFPEFAMKKNGNQYTWEFSLKVYRDTYDPMNPSDTSLAILEPGKIMGLDMAYCDDDTPMDPKRKSFIGSVWVPELKYNDHWMDAGDFGVARLEKKPVSTQVSKMQPKILDCYYSSYDKSVHLNDATGNPGKMDIRIYNLLGSLVIQAEISNGSYQYSHQLPLGQVPSGIYLVTCTQGKYRFIKKLYII